jgi:hypothetical protein
MTSPECGRPGRSNVRMFERLPVFRTPAHALRCCARGRAHSAKVGFRSHWLITTAGCILGVGIANLVGQAGILQYPNI